MKPPLPKYTTTAWVFLLATLMLPLTVLFAPQQLTQLFLLTGMGCVATRHREILPYLKRPFLWASAIFLLLAWGVVSSGWSLDAGESLKRSFKVLGYVLLGGFVCRAAAGLASRESKMVLRVLFVALIALLVLTAFERLTDKWLIQQLTYYNWEQRHGILNRPMTLLGLLFWPAAMGLYIAGRHKTAFALFLASLLVLGGSRGVAGFLALVAGAGVFLIALWRYRLAAFLLLSAVFIFTVTAPHLLSREAVIRQGYEALPETAHSVRQRLFIWEFTSNKIGEAPLFGHGMGTSRMIPGGEQRIPEALNFKERPWTRTGGNWVTMGKQAILPLHPHNTILQLHLELGIVGALMGVLVLASLLFGLRKTINGEGRIHVFRLAAIGAALIPLMVSFSIWQSWWLSFLFLLAAFMCMTPSNSSVGRDE